jgi:hypothetical protein
MQCYALRTAGWTFRLTRGLVLAGIGLMLYVLLAPAAQAAGPDESTPSYAVTISVARDGVAHIAERISYDFGTTPHHGIIRYIPVTYDYPPKSGYDRVLKVSNIKVASDAPSKFTTSHSGRDLVIKIGDPHKTITGVHIYTLDYDVLGALNAFASHVQLDWNALGTQWDAPVGVASVAVHFPAAVTSVTCFRGPQLASLPCTSAKVKAGVARVTQHSLGIDEGVTVSVVAPLSSVGTAAALPILKERWSAKKAFSITPLTVLGALLIAVLGLLGVAALAWGIGRDRRFLSQIPGLTPVGGVGPEGREPLLDRTPVAVEFQPPDGLRPGQVGTLLDERVDPLDVSATIVDLAVRGYLRIEEQERAHWFASRDWTLVALAGDTTKLLPYEALLLAKLFEGRNQVKVSELKQHFAAPMQAIKKTMYADAVSSGFFRSSPQTVRSTWTFIGLVAVGFAVLVTYLLARLTHKGLLGIGLFVAAVGLLAMAHRMPARTAKGRAALVKTLGFRTYLGTAEANQLKFEEKEDIFSRYLPYAMVFHETDHWAKVFASVGAGGVGGAAVTPALLWYVGPAGWDFGSLGDSLNSFAVSTGSALTSSAVSSGSGGASFSGGGFGGGGGGSW